MKLFIGCLGLFSMAATLSAAEVKILAQGRWSLPVHAATAATRERQERVIRSERDLAKAAGPHALPAILRSLMVDSINFQKQMLLAISDGTLPMVGVSGGGPPSVPNRMEIVRAALDDKGDTMLVSWRLAPRDEKQDVITLPLEVALVERFDGSVKFERLPTRAGAPDKEEKPAAGKDVKIIARAFWPDGWKAEESARQWIVRSADELIDPRLRAPENVLERMRQENLAKYAKALKVDTVDFTKQMIIGVSAGVQPAAGCQVEVIRVEKVAKDNRLTIHWRLNVPTDNPKKGGLTHPAAVALIEQFPGAVTFVEETPKNK